MSIIRSMNDETYTPCTKCGRPMAYCKGQCCGQPKGCECREYGPMKKGCIRQIEPSCPYEAVIPTLTVEDKSNIKDLADCFVHVSNINTTFYIDDKHRMMVTWAGPVEYDNYDLDANTLGLRSQFLIDNANEYAAYYDKTGAYQLFNYNGNGASTLESWRITYPFFASCSTLEPSGDDLIYITSDNGMNSEWGMPYGSFILHPGMRCSVAINRPMRNNSTEVGFAVHTNFGNYIKRPIYKQLKYVDNTLTAAQPLLVGDIPSVTNSSTVLDLVYAENRAYSGWIVTNL